MLRDQSGATSASTVNGSRYFYATNQTTKELPAATGAASFYRALLAVERKDSRILGQGMQVNLTAAVTLILCTVSHSVAVTSGRFSMIGAGDSTGQRQAAARHGQRRDAGDAQCVHTGRRSGCVMPCGDLGGGGRGSRAPVEYPMYMCNLRCIECRRQEL
jgi:hypothetical protein